MGLPGSRWTRKNDGDRDEEDDDDEEHQPLDDVTGHVASFPPSESVVSFGAGRPPPAANDPRPRAHCPTMRPMPEEVPALTGRTRIVAGVGVGLVVAAGLYLRFWTRSGLWLDEALTVDIARLPLHEIPNALKHDGAPPLYYYLLHFWISLFGQSNDAVRALSGVFAVLTLPVGWLCGKRLGGRAVAWTMLVLLASAPFAVYYATESRMYSLVILLTGCGFLALERAVSAPRPGQPDRRGASSRRPCSTPSTGPSTSSAWWPSGSSCPSCAAAAADTPRTLRGPRSIAVAAGCLLFVPWVPTFLYQAKHTGTPWAAPPNFSAVINALTGFTDNQGSTLQTATNQGRLLAVIYFCMLALAVFGVGRSGRIIELDLRTRPRSRASGLRRAGDPVRRHRRGHHHRERVLLPLRGRGLPPLPPPHRTGDDHAPQPEGPGGRRRARGGGRPRVVGPERDHAAHPGRRRGGRPQHVRQAGRRHRLLPRPAGAGGLPADPEPVAVRHDHLPPSDGPADRRLGRLRRHRARSGPELLRRRGVPEDRARPSHLAGLAADVPDLRRQVRDDRHRPPERVDQERRRWAQLRDQPRGACSTSR